MPLAVNGHRTSRASLARQRHQPAPDLPAREGPPSRSPSSTGGLIFAWLVWEIGVAAIMAQLRQLSWRLPLILLPQAVTNVFKTAGWGAAFPRSAPPLRPPLPRPARRGGGQRDDAHGDDGRGRAEGVPPRAGGVGRPDRGGAPLGRGGEDRPGRGAGGLHRGRLRPRAGRSRTRPRRMLVLLALLAAYMAASTAGFMWAQLRGIFRLGGRALAWIGLGERVAAVAGRLDADLRRFYRDERGRAWRPRSGTASSGWATGALETWLMLALLGSPVALDDRASSSRRARPASARSGSSFRARSASWRAGSSACSRSFAWIPRPGLAFGIVRTDPRGGVDPRRVRMPRPAARETGRAGQTRVLSRRPGGASARGFFLAVDEATR